MNETSKKAVDFAGFPDAGIAGLESDEKRQPTQARTPKAQPQSSARPASSQQSSPTAASPPTDSSSGGEKVWLWILAGCIIFVIWAANQQEAPSRPTNPLPAAYTPPREIPPQTSPTSTVVQALPERAPPSDRNAVLSIEEARYCVFWRARIEKMEELAIHEPLLEPLQQYYDRYNGECVKRRFRDNYDRAIAELEDRRSTIEQEAVEIVNSWKPTYLAPVVRSIQEDLNDLGYDAGPVDGLYGPKTRDAIVRIYRAAGMEDDGRISYGLRDQLRQITTERRHEQTASNSSANDEAGDGPQRWFGLVNGTSADDVEFIQTNKIPKIPGQLFGWYIWVGEQNEEIHWREKYSVPDPAPSWEGVEDAPNVEISGDRRVVTTQKRMVPQGGYLFNLWGVAADDPLGTHSIVVTIDNDRVEIFKFQLVNP